MTGTYQNPSLLSHERENVSRSVKIGWTLDPVRRVAGLQTGNPCELSLVELIPGDRTLEAIIHAEIRSERVRGEWFAGKETRRMIEKIASASEAAIQHFKSHQTFPEPLATYRRLGLQMREVVVAAPANEPVARRVSQEEWERGKSPEYLAQLRLPPGIHNARSVTDRSQQIRSNPLNNPGKGRNTSGVRELDELRIDGKQPLLIRRKAA